MLALLGSVGIYGIVKAQSDEAGGYPPFIQKLAEKFNLNVSDVKAFFDENRPAKMEPGKNFEAKLDEAVTDGELTAEQKALILAKRDEIKSQMQANRDANKDLSKEQRKAAMEAKRIELETWAKANNIDLKYVMGGRGFGLGGPGDCGCSRNGPSPQK